MKEESKYENGNIRWEVWLFGQIPILNQYERWQRNSEELLDLN
jgi:hypothetical protein